MLTTGQVALISMQSAGVGLVPASPSSNTYVWGVLAIVVLGALLWSLAWSRRNRL